MTEARTAAAAQDERQLLGTADQLDDDRRCLEAIDRLQAANRALRSPLVEERLVELRRDAVGELDPAADPPRPEFADPFPGRTDLIELAADEATPELVGGAIQHHGCALIRGLLSAPHVAMLRDDIDRAFDALDRAKEGEGPERTRPWYVPLEAHPDRPAHHPEARGYKSLMRVCTVDSPRAMYDVVEAYEADGIHDLIRALLGTRPIMTSNKWALRKMTSRKMNPWHQEASVFARAASSTPNLRTVNVWMSLGEAGDNAPGFDVLPRRETEVHAANAVYSITPDVFERVRDRDFASPVYGPGDAMVFDEMLLHRTNSKGSMTGTRYSIESWFFSPGGLPERDAVVL